MILIQDDTIQDGPESLFRVRVSFALECVCAIHTACRGGHAVESLSPTGMP